MMNTAVSKSPARWLVSVGLLGIAFFGRLEIQAMLAIPQNWDRLLSDAGLLTIALYLLILLIGLAAIVAGWFAPAALRALSLRLQRFGWVRWLVIAFGLLLVAWFYLYSPWQAVWPGPWVQFIFALGLATSIAWLAQPGWRIWPDGSEFVFALAVFLYPRVILELRAWFQISIIYRGATLLGYLLLLGLAVWLFTSQGRSAAAELAARRKDLGRIRWFLAIALICAPLLYLALVGAKFYAVNAAIRFSLLLIELFGLALLIENEDTKVVSLKSLVLGAFALALVSFIGNNLLLVVDYPFSLSWSEGNRFYDYSLFFGQDLYNHVGTIVNPYGQPGRYIEWAALFLWPGLSIQVHRLWDVVVTTVPAVLVGWIVVRKFRDSYLRLGLALFVSLLFTVLSPLHPPFLVAAAIALWFIYDSSLVRRAVVLAIASLYVGTSRWTWIPVTAAWGILTDLLLYYPARQGNLLKRLTPTLILAAAGLLPGLASGWSGLPLSSSAREYHQPLLWYRLLPNPTFPLGVLFSTILISGPLVAILAWWMLSGRWKLDWLQQLAVAGGLIGFLGAGLVVSTKIGGGADLHNMDMFLMTLVLVMVLGLYVMSSAGRIDLLSWPVGVQLLIGFMILYPLYSFTPFFSGAGTSPVLELPKPQEVGTALQEIQSNSDAAGQHGEVLFMDQRQLLTFGYIHNVRFVPEYEKKYMMDMAMGGDSEYFQQYYQDLARKRFSLIVTEILHTRQETGADFSEENNAWVKWVSEPTLCFYEPSVINKDVGVELLVPRQDPVGCDSYLHPGE